MFPPAAILLLGLVGFQDPDSRGLIARLGRPGELPGQAPYLVGLPTGQRIAAAYAGGLVRVYDGATGRSVAELRLPSGWEFRGLAGLPDGRTIAIAGAREVALWELTARELGRRFPIPDVTRLQVDPDGQSLLAVRRGAPVRIDVETGAETPVKVRGHVLDLSSTAGRVAVKIDEITLRIADLAAKDNRPEIIIPEPFSAVALFPNGRALATLHDKAVRYWNAATGQFLTKTTLAGAADSSAAPVFSPDSRMVALRTNGSSVVIIEAFSGREFLTLGVPRVASMAFSRDSKLLVTGCSDGSALVWNLMPPEYRPVSPEDIASSDLERWWSWLGDDDIPKAQQGMWLLEDAGEKGLEKVKIQLALWPKPPEWIRMIIQDLDRDGAPRKRALEELNLLGPWAEDEMRRTLEGEPSERVRRDLRDFLDVLEAPMTKNRAALLRLRAIQLLERIGTDAAREALATMARESPSMREREEAMASLDRLGR